MPLGIRCMCLTVHTRSHTYLGTLDMNYMNDTINVPAPLICCQEGCPDIRVQFSDGQVHLDLGMFVQRNAKSLSASHQNNMATIVHATVRECAWIVHNLSVCKQDSITECYRRQVVRVLGNPARLRNNIW
jgi:hypothetical protein